MSSITVINLTAGPINSACVAIGTISSTKNLISPNEFYVHSAAGVYDLKIRNFTGRETLFETNPCTWKTYFHEFQSICLVLLFGVRI